MKSLNLAGFDIFLMGLGPLALLSWSD